MTIPRGSSLTAASLASAAWASAARFSAAARASCSVESFSAVASPLRSEAASAVRVWLRSCFVFATTLPWVVW